MSRRKTFNMPGHAHFLTFSCWQRQPLLRDCAACRIFLQSLEEARAQERFAVWAYVLMPEHVHLLIRPLSETYEMARILRRIKEPAARSVLTVWRKDHPERLAAAADTTAGLTRHRFWQPGGGYDRNLYTPDLIRHTIAYIEGNPVRRGLVSSPLEWEWSSAKARTGQADVPLRLDELTL